MLCRYCFSTTLRRVQAKKESLKLSDKHHNLLVDTDDVNMLDGSLQGVKFASMDQFSITDKNKGMLCFVDRASRNMRVMKPT
jgi:hypothetical protein